MAEAGRYDANEDLTILRSLEVDLFNLERAIGFSGMAARVFMIVSLLCCFSVNWDERLLSARFDD